MTSDRPSSTVSAKTSSGFLGWVTCFAIAFALYALTANRGAQWQDSGYFILRTVTGESVNPLGLALTHPLHYWLCRFAASLHFGEPALAVTLVSSLAAACCVANVRGCVLALTSDRIAAALAAISLALANTFWQLATIAETYTVTAALLSAECWCLGVFSMHASRKVAAPMPEPRRPIESTISKPHVSASHSASPPFNDRDNRRWFVFAFVGFFFFNGLGLSNHNLALLTTPILGAVALVAMRRAYVNWIHVSIAALAWLIGSLPYSGLVVMEAVHTGDLGAAIHSAFFGGAFEHEVLNTSISGSRLLIIAAFIGLNFPNLLLPASLLGILRPKGIPGSRLARRALLAALLLHAAFAFRYPVPDQHYFFVPMYVLLVIFGGIGLASWRGGRDSLPIANTTRIEPTQKQRKSTIRVDTVTVVAAALLAGTPILYSLVPALAKRFDALGFVERHKPYRDDYVYLFIPWSVVEQSADRMSREAVRLAGEKGVVIAEDQMAGFALHYRAVRDGKAGIEIIHEAEPGNVLQAVSENRSVVLVPRSLDEPMTPPIVGAWRRVGDLYILVP